MLLYPHANRLLLLGLLSSAWLVACQNTPMTAASVETRTVNTADKPTSPKGKSASTLSSATPTRKYSGNGASTYTVKKGDTLFAISLEQGYDYKDIANVNQITPPYTIRIGQVLQLPTRPKNPTENLSPLATPTAPRTNNDARTNNDDSVTVIPLKQDAPINVVSKPISPPPPSETSVNKEAPPPVIPSSTAPPPTVANHEAKPETKAVNKSETVAATKNWLWPTQGKITRPFGNGNKGIDIEGVSGQSIQAITNGKVIYAGSGIRGYGKLVIVQNNALHFVYAHNNVLLVKEGQMVAQGQKIAEMGNTDSPTIKLHFEIRQQGKPVDPLNFVSPPLQ